MSLVVFVSLAIACIYMEVYSSIWVKFGFHRNYCLYSFHFRSYTHKRNQTTRIMRGDL